MKIYLQRWEEWPDGQGTPGVIYYVTRHPIGLSQIEVCKTVELPWQGNQTSISRIPAGTYKLDPWSSQRFPQALHLRGVPARSAILIHPGNWAGDVAQGCKSDVRGCIAPCRRHGELSGQRAGLSSREAMAKLLRLEPTEIEILDDPGLVAERESRKPMEATDA